MSDGKDGGTINIINLISSTRDDFASRNIDKVSIKDEMAFGYDSFKELNENNIIKKNSKLNNILTKLTANLYNSKY